MYSRKSVGLRMEPWRTPTLTGYSCEDFPSRTTKVTFLSILLSSFDFHKKKICGRICYIIINFFAKFHWNLLKKFEVIAYVSNWTFYGCSQSCLCFLNMSIKCQERIKFHTKSYKWKESNNIPNGVP